MNLEQRTEDTPVELSLSAMCFHRTNEPKQIVYSKIGTLEVRGIFCKETCYPYYKKLEAGYIKAEQEKGHI